MKKLTYECKHCKKMLIETTNSPVIPTNTVCIECGCQTQLRKKEDVKEEPSKK